MKKFIAGFLSGAIIFSVVGVFAVNSIYDNPYKITVNGAEKYIQGYNIDDYSYFKLRDIADAVGGFSVGFDEQNQTIVLSANEDITSPAATANPADSSSDTDNLPLGTIPDPMLLKRPDEIFGEVYVTNDEFQIVTANGHYVILDYIVNKANEIVGEERFTRFGGDIVDRKNDYTHILSDVGDKNSRTVSLEYYYLHLAPWLRSLNK